MQARELTSEDIDRITQMAWEDRTTFDAIKLQFGLTPGEVVQLMRKTLSRTVIPMLAEENRGS